MGNQFHSKIKLEKGGLAMGAMVRAFGPLIEKDLPKAEYHKVVKKDLWIPMPDGVKLAATAVFPDAKGGPWPVVMIANPYAVGEDMYREMLMPIFARQGYVGLYVRNRGSLYSEGEWTPFENERKDGRATVDWVANQSWCDGNIGTYGSSYCGFTQWAVADYDNPALKTMFISVAGPVPYDVFYRRGMFRQDIWTYWAATMMGKYRFKSSFGNKFRKKAFSVTPQINLGQELIGEDCPWYDNWVSNTLETDSYWSEGFWKDFADCVKKVKIPMFIHTGWYDVFCRSVFESYRQLPEEVMKQSRVVIGPWGHSGLPARDALKFPGENNVGLLQMTAAIEWFDHFLKGKPYPQKTGVVEAYSIGDNKWVTWKGDITPEGTKKFFLNTDSEGRGILDPETTENASEITYQYDPEKPVPSCGGTVLNNVERGTGAEKACVVQPKVDSDPSVINFVTEPLKENLHVAGAVEAYLNVKSNVSATAFTIKICELFEDGRSVNIRDDITDIRWRDEHTVKAYTPGENAYLHLKLLDCEWMFKKGSRIRVDISSSNYPSYHTHPNTEDNWAKTTNHVVATQTICCGGEDGSYVTFPFYSAT